MQFVIENQLVPMMIRNGFDLAGCTFKYDDSESLPLAEQAKIDASFMPYVKFDHEYLEQKYGIELQDEEEEPNGSETDSKADTETDTDTDTDTDSQVENIAKRLRAIYS
jgi:hypothetical protein